MILRVSFSGWYLHFFIRAASAEYEHREDAPRFTFRQQLVNIPENVPVFWSIFHNLWRMDKFVPLGPIEQGKQFLRKWLWLDTGRDLLQTFERENPDSMLTKINSQIFQEIKNIQINQIVWFQSRMTNKCIELNQIFHTWRLDESLRPPL